MPTTSFRSPARRGLSRRPADSPIIFLALTSDTAQSQEMNEFADKVMSPKLSTLPGVAQINIQGAQKRAVRIKYDLDALATRGISVEEVRLAVTALSSVAPIGSIRTGQQYYILEIKGAEPYAAYFKPAVVAWRNGAPVRLGEAQLTDGPWCSDPDVPNRWDADLLRVRRMSMMLRVQAGQSRYRGTDPRLFRNPGTALAFARSVPDREIRFDVALRNLGLAR